MSEDRPTASVTLDTIIATVVAKKFREDYGTPAFTVDTITRAVTDALIAKGKIQRRHDPSDTRRYIEGLWLPTGKAAS